MEIDHAFRSFAEWQAFAAANSYVYDKRKVEDFGQALLSGGFRDPFTEHSIDPSNIRHWPGFWHQSLGVNGIISRFRATALIVRKTLQNDALSDRDALIYGAEAVTQFAERMIEAFPRYVGSEYMPDPNEQRRRWPILHQDLTALTFPSGRFDLVVTNEVLEHVSNLDKALAEIARVLRPSGWHVGTLPFRVVHEESDLRTILRDGVLVYLKEPEYHGNPISEKGSLVFEIPGWDVLKRARQAGFRDAHMRFVASSKYGIIGNQMGVFVFCAQK